MALENGTRLTHRIWCTPTRCQRTKANRQQPRAGYGTSFARSFVRSFVRFIVQLPLFPGENSNDPPWILYLVATCDAETIASVSAREWGVKRRPSEFSPAVARLGARLPAVRPLRRLARCVAGT